MADKGITSRTEDFSAWYNDVIQRAQLADHSPVRGCMVIRPEGYGIWELMQEGLDGMFKATGHRNAYFPLFIPMSFLAREAEHVEGFAKEAALVTHTRLKATGETGKNAIAVDPDSALEEPLVVRPTSETIMYEMFSKWIQSYRDLPLLINQWANVVRWEMRTRLFLRTSEFLWQEGHTAHATEPEAREEAATILGLYRSFAENWMAMPVLTGIKTASERFAGAVDTYAIEALMQDNKALQAGTSHFLGQNFAKAFGTQFQTRDGGLDFVWSTSWGVSTRLIGGLIMTHSDDTGFVCPPRLAPVQVVIVPIARKDDDRARVAQAVDTVLDALKQAGIRVHVDDRDSMKPGAKYFEWEGKGVPLRLEIGPRDVEAGHAMASCRTGGKEPVSLDGISDHANRLLEKIQNDLFESARARLKEKSHVVSDRAEFESVIEERGGFLHGGFCGGEECEAEVKAATKATVRVLPDEEFRLIEGPTSCAWCGKASVSEAVWARAY